MELMKVSKTSVLGSQGDQELSLRQSFLTSEYISRSYEPGGRGLGFRKPGVMGFKEN
jgi:hypothetical protein